jgi:hypothetical protein
MERLQLFRRPAGRSGTIGALLRAQNAGHGKSEGG